jgi:hypothetical protein
LRNWEGKGFAESVAEHAIRIAEGYNKRGWCPQDTIIKNLPKVVRAREWTGVGMVEIQRKEEAKEEYEERRRAYCQSRNLIYTYNYGILEIELGKGSEHLGIWVERIMLNYGQLVPSLVLINNRSDQGKITHGQVDCLAEESRTSAFIPVNGWDKDVKERRRH